MLIVNWLKAPLCGKLSGNHNSKTPPNPPGNWLKAPLCGKRSGNHNSKTPQNPPGNWLKAPRFKTLNMPDLHDGHGFCDFHFSGFFRGIGQLWEFLIIIDFFAIL